MRFFSFFVALFLLPQVGFPQAQPLKVHFSELTHKIYQHNPALLAARQELAETKELYYQARAGWLPTVTGQASIYTTEIDSSNFGSGDGATTKDITLDLNQPIWSGGRTFSEVDRVNSVIMAGEAVLKDFESDLILDALIAVADVLRDRQLLSLRQNNKSILEEEVRAVQEQLDLGFLTKTDLNQTLARYSRAQANVIAAQRDLDESLAIYEDVLHGPAPANMMVGYEDFPFASDFEGMVRTAIENNPQVQIAMYEEEAAKYNVKSNFRTLLPQISAFASYNKQYDPQPGIISDSEVQTAGLRATIALYEGGAARSRIREAKEALKRRGYEIEDIKRQIRRDVAVQLKSYQAARAQTQERRKEIKAAEAALEGVREEARIGQRTVLDVLDSDEDLIEAEVALIRAQRSEVVSEFTLARTLGLLHF